jgi:tetratricopeptide (TPR) repeat protein
MGDAQKIQPPGASGAPLVEIEQPSRLRRRAMAVAVMATALFGLAAAAASYNWYQSHRALNAAHAVILQLAETSSETIPANADSETVDAVLQKARQAIDAFAFKTSEPSAILQRARLLLTFAQIDWDRGQAASARRDTQSAFLTLEPLAKAGNLEARHLRAQARRLAGLSDIASGDTDAARLHYEQGISELTELLKFEANAKISWRWMRSLAALHEAQGDIMLMLIRPQDALKEFEAAQSLRERVAQLGYQGPAQEHDLAWITNKRGEVEERRGNLESALRLFSDASDRLDGLKDRIWDNPAWAQNFGTVASNVGRIKREQNRFAEAAAMFARAEDLVAAVAKRDPKNFARATTLNEIRFLRVETLFRLAVQHNDRIRLLAAREQMLAVIAASAEISNADGIRGRVQRNQVRENAFLAAIDATLRQWNGNHESAAMGFIEAAEIVEKAHLQSVKLPWADLLGEQIEYLERAGIAYTRARKIPEGQKLFNRALELVQEHRAIMGERRHAELHERIAARLERNAPPASPTADREPPLSASVPAAEITPPETGSVSPLPQ